MVEDTKRVRSVALMAQRKYCQDEEPSTLIQGVSGGNVAEKVEEEEDTKKELEAKSEKDFYSMEELESLDDEYVAYLVKRYSKLKFQRHKGGRKATPKLSGEKKTLIDKSKIKCYKCNIMGHFA